MKRTWLLEKVTRWGFQVVLYFLKQIKNIMAWQTICSDNVFFPNKIVCVEKSSHFLLLNYFKKMVYKSVYLDTATIRMFESVAYNCWKSFNFTRCLKNTELMCETWEQQSYMSVSCVYIEKQWKNSALEWKMASNSVETVCVTLNGCMQESDLWETSVSLRLWKTASV